jgi:hypothetical protein
VCAHKLSAIIVDMAMTSAQDASLLVDLWRTWSPAVALAVAALALVAAQSQARSAKKALRLALVQDARTTARLDLSLRDSALWTLRSEGRRFVGVRVLAVNPAESSGTLTHAELHLSYEVSSEQILTLKIPLADDTASIPGISQSLASPISIPDNGAVEGWLIFGFDHDLIGDRPIRGYDVTITDSRGISASVQPWVMREITL